MVVSGAQTFASGVPRFVWLEDGPGRSRDYNGMRGLVPTMLGSMEWQCARRWCRAFDALRALGLRPRPAPTGRGRFARGTYRVRL